MTYAISVLGAAALVLTVCSAACGGGEPTRQARPDRQGEAPAAAGASALVSADAVRQCAHFSADDAAAVLGAPAGDIEATSSDIHDTLRMCHYLSKSDRAAVSFSLATNESVEAAVSAMASGRQNAGMARKAIDTVTATSSAGPAYDEVEGIGEEAYWMQVNGTLNVRVRNVEIQIQSPDDREKQKEVARRIVAGLGA